MTDAMARVYVSIGSNIGREKNIRGALQSLEQRYGKLFRSSIYETGAVGFDGDNFFNLVAGFDTQESPAQVAEQLHHIEDLHGRNRDGPRFAARTLDIDLLLYDDLVLRDSGVNIPRDEITRYAFVLKPLAEIAGGMRHPVLNRTFADLWAAFDDSDQILWPAEFAP